MVFSLENFSRKSIKKLEESLHDLINGHVLDLG